jgi:hypothetical protein
LDARRWEDAGLQDAYATGTNAQTHVDWSTYNARPFSPFSGRVAAQSVLRAKGIAREACLSQLGSWRPCGF